MSTKTPDLLREPATLVAAGPLSGIVCAVLDLAVTRGPEGMLLSAGAYAAAIGTLWGLVLGLVVAVAVLLASMLARRGAPRVVVLLPAALPAVVAFIALSMPLFEGPWIQSRSWVHLARWGWILVGAGALVLVCHLVGRLSRLAGGKRVVVVIAALVLAVAATRLDLTAFGAYQTLKWMFTGAAALCALAAVRFATPREGLAAPVALGLAIALAAAGTGTAAIQRHGSSIHRIRAAIIGVPLPITSRLLVPVEQTWLDRFGKLPGVARISRTDAAFADQALNPVYDEEAVVRELDARAPLRRRFNIVMIALDAMRADHLSCEGYPRPTTPRLDALAQKSSWFRRAVSPVPSSSMGYGCVMSGLMGRITPAYAAEFKVEFPVPQNLSIASQLRAGGWATTGITAFYKAVAELPQFRLMAEGFDAWNVDQPTIELRAPEVTDRALALLRSRSRGSKPFFLFLHYMEPHAPYYFHPEHDFGREPIDAYDSEIAFADASVGRIFDELQSSGEAERTIIVAFGDHGEGFGEHNNREHGASLHDHQVRVPLIIHMPGLAPREIKGWVGLSDLPVTLMQLVGIADPNKRLGRDLTPLMVGAPGSWPDVVYAERAASAGKEPRSWERAVWHGDLKLIWKPHHGTFQVYDIAKDPRESRNLYDPEDHAHAELLALLEAFDRRIDGYWPGATGATTRPASIVDRFAAAVDRFVAADAAAQDATLTDVFKFLDTPGIDRSAAERGQLGTAALAKLRDRLVATIPTMGHDSKAREYGLRMLFFMDDPALDDLIWSELKKGGHDQLMLQLAVHLARHGRREPEEALKVGFGSSYVDGRVYCGAGLAWLGDPRGRDYLVMALERGWSDIVHTAAYGLAALKDPMPLARALVSRRPIWKHPLVEAALLFGAKQARTPTATAVLLKLAASSTESITRDANAELERRLTATELERARAIREAFAGADNALLYNDSKLAAKFLETCGEGDDPWIGYLWWKVFRISYELGDREAGARALDRLVASAPEIPWVPSLAAAGRAALAAPAPGPGDLRFSAMLDRPPPIDDRVSDVFCARVQLKNEGTKYVPGGEWSGEVQLRWRATDAQGREVAAIDDPRTHLPDEGIAPGATAVIGAMGRLPPAPGAYKLQLVAVAGEGDAAVAIPIGAPIAVTPR